MGVPPTWHTAGSYPRWSDTSWWQHWPAEEWSSWPPQTASPPRQAHARPPRPFQARGPKRFSTLETGLADVIDVRHRQGGHPPTFQCVRHDPLAARAAPPGSDAITPRPSQETSAPASADAAEAGIAPTSPPPDAPEPPDDEETPLPAGATCPVLEAPPDPGAQAFPADVPAHDLPATQAPPGGGTDTVALPADATGTEAAGPNVDIPAEGATPAPGADGGVPGVSTGPPLLSPAHAAAAAPPSKGSLPEDTDVPPASGRGGDTPDPTPTGPPPHACPPHFGLPADAATPNLLPPSGVPRSSLHGIPAASARESLPPTQTATARPRPLRAQQSPFASGGPARVPQPPPRAPPQQAFGWFATLFNSGSN